MNSNMENKDLDPRDYELKSLASGIHFFKLSFESNFINSVKVHTVYFPKLVQFPFLLHETVFYKRRVYTS